ncbi:hypothetical protein [Pedobacter soli]|uniref:Uncharacterized protein n=1 Tax=Pedobacter soli TaxID=390242 RepID=A0A1G6WNC7_9SPHI|nr:hypothetical protein [Pedobacter soli]SDD67450.1 hypothetical protein SAMN04488024_10775 [Pedobacter soli]
MERVILLKTQLAEAGKLAKSNEFAKQRLAVILLDNFIEIQLAELMKNRFSRDDWFTSRPPKYSYTLRKKILYNYDDMLKACISEHIITREERDTLSFCHDVRNNLYHQAKEELLLTTIALRFLTDAILKYQPDWRSGRDFMSINMTTKDPYLTNSDIKPGWAANSKEEWVAFLEKYFTFQTDQVKGISAMVSEHLLNKVGIAKGYYQFLLEEQGNFSSDDWKLNEYLIFYSFYNAKEFELKNLKAGNDSLSYNDGHKKMILAYKKNWTYVKPTRLDTLENTFKQIIKLSPHKALCKLIAFRTEMNMIFDALGNAAHALDAEIESQIERLRGN